MSEKELLADLQQVDGLLARCTCPALTRNEHDALRQVMSVTLQRVKLSFQLEREKKDAEASKEVEKDE